MSGTSRVTRIPMLDLVRQQTNIKEALNRVISSVIEEGRYISEEKVTPFEARLAAFCDRSYAVGVNSGTTALQIALMAAGVGKSSEVITVPNSFFATTEAILSVGAIPRFVDVDPETHLMSLPALREAVNERTTAILPVHLYGNVVDVRAIRKMLKESGREEIVIVEDCAHAMGSARSGQRVPLGGIGAFSFNPGKNIGALSDAGAIVTADEDVARRARLLRDHGRGQSKDDHIEIGMNARLGRLNDQVLALKMDYLAEWNAIRREHAARYDSAFSGLRGISSVRTEFDTCSARHQYVIRCERRDELRHFLSERGVATGIHYPRLISEQEPLQRLGYRVEDVPVAKQLSLQILSLPCYPELHESQITRVIGLVQEFARR